MTTKDRFINRYKTGDTPWDTGKPDFNLIETVNGHPISGCRALEVGCGTGDNSIWLAQNGFHVTGTDLSEIALNKARKKATEANVTCDFRLVDFLQSSIETAHFGFIFDRGCFHSFNAEDDRERFANNVANHLKDAGLWLTLAGNADEDRKGPGPPQRSARDIVLAVEPYFVSRSLGNGDVGFIVPGPDMTGGENRNQENNEFVDWSFYHAKWLNSG